MVEVWLVLLMLLVVGVSMYLMICAFHQVYGWVHRVVGCYQASHPASHHAYHHLGCDELFDRMAMMMMMIMWMDRSGDDYNSSLECAHEGGDNTGDDSTWYVPAPFAIALRDQR